MLILYLQNKRPYRPTSVSTRQDRDKSDSQGRIECPARDRHTLMDSDLLCCLDCSLHPHKLWHTLFLFRIWAMSNSTQLHFLQCTRSPSKHLQSLSLAHSLNTTSKLILKSVPYPSLNVSEVFKCQLWYVSKMLLLQKSLFLCACVCVWVYLWKIWKGNDNDLIVDIHYSFCYYTAVRPSALTTFFSFECFWHFILTPNSINGGAVVQEEMCHYLTEKLMVIHQIILCIDVGVSPLLRLMMLPSLNVSLCLYECVYVSVCGFILTLWCSRISHLIL